MRLIRLSRGRRAAAETQYLDARPPPPFVSQRQPLKRDPSGFRPELVVANRSAPEPEWNPPRQRKPAGTIKIMTAPDGCRVVRPDGKQQENSRNGPAASQLIINNTDYGVQAHP